MNTHSHIDKRSVSMETPSISQQTSSQPRSAPRPIEKAPMAAPITAPLSLPPLPYAEDALEPVISAETLTFHHGRHHRTYIENTNRLITGTELADLPLEKIVSMTAGKAERVNI